MDHAVKLVSVKDLLQPFSVACVYDFKIDLLSCDLLYTGHRIALRIGEIIYDDDIVAGIDKLDCGMRAYVSRTS